MGGVGLVLSHNKIEEVTCLNSLSKLTKLSVAHNKLKVFPELPDKAALKEIRLNDNKLLTIPDHVRYLPRSVSQCVE
jgi:Leucine-rich repeat (LRR) protein